MTDEQVIEYIEYIGNIGWEWSHIMGDGTKIFIAMTDDEEMGIVKGQYYSSSEILSLWKEMNERNEADETFNIVLRNHALSYNNWRANSDGNGYQYDKYNNPGDNAYYPTEEEIYVYWMDEQLSKDNVKRTTIQKDIFIVELKRAVLDLKRELDKYQNKNLIDDDIKVSEQSADPNPIRTLLSILPQAITEEGNEYALTITHRSYKLDETNSEIKVVASYYCSSTFAVWMDVISIESDIVEALSGLMKKIPEDYLTF